MKLQHLAISPQNSLKNVGWDWMLGDGALPYITNEVVEISDAEAEAFYNAANELYEMYVAATEWVIKNKKYAQLGIPENLIEIIETSWEKDKSWHLYGRFDLAGGIDNQPIKLIEFNADTATCIPETAIVQWALLKANGLDESRQFNTLYESLVEMFQKIRAENASFHPCMLFATMEGFPEDDTNVNVLMQAAEDADFEAGFCYVTDIEFSAENGVFKSNTDGSFTKFDFLFKLLPWEFIGWNEPELAQILTQIVRNNRVVIINPAYTLLFQSKGILKILWDLFPNHPLLLETSDTPLWGQPMVKKVLLGREGANVSILNAYGQPSETNGGDYNEQASVFQAFTQLVTDSEARHYQAGVFVAAEPCGLGFRRGGKIIDNTAQFCGHIIVE